MAEFALMAVLRAVKARLSGANEPWSTKVYDGSAAVDARRPYVIMAMSAGEEMNNRHADDAVIVLDVICIHDEKREALNAAARIGELLNNQGVQDRGVATPLSGGTWQINTVTQEQFIAIDEMVDEVQDLYHAGASFRFKLERIS